MATLKLDAFLDPVRTVEFGGVDYVVKEICLADQFRLHEASKRPDLDELVFARDCIRTYLPGMSEEIVGRLSLSQIGILQNFLLFGTEPGQEEPTEKN